MPLIAWHDGERRARRVVLVCFAVVTVWFGGAYHRFVNPNELSRLEMIYAVVEQGTFRIDDAVRILGDHDDKAVSGGHFYSNKAPGLALAAIPVYRFLRIFFPAARSASDPILTGLLPLLTVSVAAIAALERLGARLALSGSRSAALVMFAIAFGTSYLYYSRSFFGHVWSSALLFLGWDLLRVAEERSAERRSGFWTLGAGLLAGWAFLSEYSVAPILLCLLVRAGAGRSWRRIAFFCGGLAVPALILLAYQKICFGSAFTPSYAHEAYPAYADLARQRLFGFSWPDPAILWNFLFHPARGVLLFSPFLVWAGAGLLRWWRSSEDRADCLFISCSLILILVFLSAYPNWHGGWSLGSRYLLPIFLFAAVAVGRALDTSVSRGLFLAAVVFSVANHFLLTLSWSSFPIFVPWPAATASRWFLARGWISPHIGPASTAGDALSVVLALTALVIGLAASAQAAEPFRPPLVAGFVAGLLPLVLLCARPPELSFQARLWRAAIFGKYSALDPTRKELREVAASARTPAERRQAAAIWLSYGVPPEAMTEPPDSSR
jgi:hypothetical protein